MLSSSFFQALTDDQADIRTPDEVELVARLLGCDKEELTQALLTTKITVAKDTVTKFKSKFKAQDDTDALSKYLYGKMFDFLLVRINKTLAPLMGAASQSFIGVLDIFGFEVFQTNRFEQLCKRKSVV